jgi:hypothetical protein
LVADRALVLLLRNCCCDNRFLHLSLSAVKSVTQHPKLSSGAVADNSLTSSSDPCSPKATGEVTSMPILKLVASAGTVRGLAWIR